LLSLPSTWSEKLSKPHQEIWLIQLHHSTGFLGVSFNDLDYDGDHYWGCVKNRPSIREKLDIVKSKAGVSNINLTLNNFQYNGASLSEEFLGGARNYINQDCKIYLQIEENESEPFSSITSSFIGETRTFGEIGAKLQIYQGRITGFTHDSKTVKVSIAAKSPWDNLTIPNVKGKDVYFPIAYGDFVGSTSAVGSEDYCEGKSFFPIPVVEKRNDTMFSLFHADSTSGSGVTSPNPHFYYKDLDRFIPLYSTTSTFDDATESYEGGQGLTTWYKLKGGLKFKPVEVVSSGGWSNVANVFDSIADDSGSTGATVNQNRTSAGTTDNEFEVKLPQYTGRISSIKIQIRLKLDATLSVDGGSPQGNLNFYYDAFGANTTFGSWTLTSGSPTQDHTNTYTSSELITDFRSTGMESIKIKASTELDTTSGLGSIAIDWTLYDIRIIIAQELDFSDEDAILDSNKFLDDIDFLYSGGDGLQKTYSGGSGTATKPHEVHRDILKRFTGTDEVTPAGWSDLDTAHNSWAIRWWLLEPESVKSILEKLQYEGCFAFWFRGDGTMRYYHRPDTPSADFTLTKNDISDLRVSHTDFSSLVTKMTINSEKHPAENRYITTATNTNSPARTKWNIQSLENHQEIDLDALVSPIGTNYNDEPNDGFYPYYANLISDVRLMISGNVLNPSISYSIEIGDVIEFSTAPLNFFGKTIAGHKFVVTKTIRKAGSTTISAYSLEEN